MTETNKKILIVEDDKNFLWLLRQSFIGENISAAFALDGEEGLKVALEEKPDLILLDILMPRMDGITVAKKLKENGIKSKIIFLTNFKDTEHISEAIEIVEGTEYIIKSDVHIDEIIARVKKKLGIK